MIGTVIPEYLAWPAKFCALISIQTWIHSVITSNVSQVDRLWTLLPTIYSAYYALLPLWPNRVLWLTPYVPEQLVYAAEDFSPRAVLLFALVVVWMCRLTYNTWRRGLLKHSEEDYRWVVLRQKLSPFLFQVTNFVFISPIQNILLLALGLPTYHAVRQPHTPLAMSDYLLTFAAVVVLSLEFTADNQQYAFHEYKHASQTKDENPKHYNSSQQWIGSRLDWKPQDAKRGFCTKGLWAFSRHPNVACEQIFWLIITAFPIFAPASPFVASFSSFSFGSRALREFGFQFLPAFSLHLLLWSSTVFTESITASKYPAYKAYQERVAMFSPLSTLVLRLVQPRESGKELDRLIWNSQKKD